MKQSAMRNVMALQSRGYMTELGLDANQIALREEKGEQKEINLWKPMVDAQKNGLVLSTHDEIDEYVLSVVRDYFRTTKKAALTLDSLFTEHGLDSLDAIEFVVRIEDELGYMVDAENLELFKKPRHFANFIKHLEAYKTEHNKAPHENTKHGFNFKEAFPGIPFISK